MNTRRAFARLAAPVAVLGLATASQLVPTASAHTSIPIAGFQFVGAGEVNGAGVVDNVVVDEQGPATDGTVIFVNADPVTHTVLIQGPANRVVTLASGEQAEITGLPRGSYSITDPGYPTMKGRFRVTGGH